MTLKEVVIETKRDEAILKLISPGFDFHQLEGKLKVDRATLSAYQVVGLHAHQTWVRIEMDLIGWWLSFELPCFLVDTTQFLIHPILFRVRLDVELTYLGQSPE